MAKHKKTGQLVKCAFCGKDKYVTQSRIRKCNFCNVHHRALYAKSSRNKDFGKGWHHTSKAIEKIRQANFKRNYDIVFTEETREKLATGAKNKVWTKEARENASKSHIGKKLPLEQIQKIKRNAKYGWKNKLWKGRYAGGVAKHIWAYKHKIEPKDCEVKNKYKGECSKRIELSNRDHKYYKKIEDWVWMCTRHHRAYELEAGLVIPKGKQKRFFGITNKYINE